MQARAVIMAGQRDVSLAPVRLNDPGPGDIVVQTRFTGISTGTEKLFWQGTMPAFPGMGYPLVPGYESFGEVVEAAADTGLAVGDHVFLPGAACYADGLRGLFGGAGSVLVSPASRAIRLDAGIGPQGALLALAATAQHAIASPGAALPQLIVGHGTLGRLLARLTIAAGGPPPTVWEISPDRRSGSFGYPVIDPASDTRRDYTSVYDASGADDLLDGLIRHLGRGAEVVLLGFYTRPIQFAFAPAFMRELRLRISAEWQPDDIAATRRLIETGVLSLEGLITHSRPVARAPDAYRTAFEDTGCLKMILDWKDAA